MRRPERSRGLTLAEVLVAASLASMLCVVLYSLFGVGVRNYERGTRQAEAHLAALLALESLERDVRRVIIDRAQVEAPVRVGPEPGSLALHLARSDSADLLRVHSRAVAYDLATGPRAGVFFLRRNGEPIAGATVRSLRFEAVGPRSPGARGVHYLRVSLEATDASGREQFPVERLFCLELPTLLWQQSRKGAP